MFGFFECIDDPELARGLISIASAWLAKRGLKKIRGPYNPSESDEVGILVDGFDTRPALLEAHTPVYYPALMEAAGMRMFNDPLLDLKIVSPDLTDLSQALPQKSSSKSLSGWNNDPT